VYDALTDVLHKHPILSVIPVDEGSTKSYFAQLPVVHLQECVSFLYRSQPPDTVTQGVDNELDAILQKQHNTNFKSVDDTFPFWRLLILRAPGAEYEFTASFIFHHAIGDGISGLIFHNTFRDALEAASSRPSHNMDVEKVISPHEGQILPPLEDLHPLPINENPIESSMASLKEWKGGCIKLPCESRYRSQSLSPSTSQAFIQDCKDKNLSVTSALPSVIAMVLFSILPVETEALTCIIPVNLRPWLTLPRGIADVSMGSYIDAFKVQVQRSGFSVAERDTTGMWPQAERVAAKIREYLDNISPSGEPYTAVAAFKNVSDVSGVFLSLLENERDAAIEVSNLGTFAGLNKTPDGVNTLWQIGRATFSRSSVVSGSAITLSVVTGGDGGLTIGFSWQEGIVENEVIERLWDGVAKYFKRY
jgi:hypothetical protein